MARLFGTDGVRGLANRELTAELALELGAAAAHVLGDAGEFAGHRPKAVVGRDPRPSGEFLEAALVAGLLSAGVDVLRVGVLPTPAVAFLTSHIQADLGVMISASHNPMPDNGIKFFGRGGHKLPDDVEIAIEVRLTEDWERPVGAAVGRVTDWEDASELYLAHVLATVVHPLDGLKVVVDCANGAAAKVSPEALRRAGAEVVVIADSLDGVSINEGVGSTHVDKLSVAVLEHGAHAGIAHDGDADRCLAVDADGRLVDGDQILAILALALRDRGGLHQDTLVATVMSNLGLKLALQGAGLHMIETAVGDRYVLEAMRAGDYTLGGEQSGHVVMAAHATTGDGILTALHLLAEVARTGQPLAELAGVVNRMPQVLINVSGVDRRALADSAPVKQALADAEGTLGSFGRVLLRASGTEPLIRVMVEAPTEQQANDVAEMLADVVRLNLAL